MPRQCTDRRFAAFEETGLLHLDHARDRGSRRRLAKNPFERRHHTVRFNDFFIRHQIDLPVRFLHGFDGLCPARRVTDTDGRRDRLWLLHHMSQHNGRRARRLKSEHPRQPPAEGLTMVFLIAPPVCGNVAGIPDGEKVKDRRIGKLFAHLEGGSFLSLQTVGIHRVHENNAIFRRDLLDDRQCLVEIPLYLQDRRAMHHCLCQLAERNLPLGNQHEDLEPGPAAIGRCGR